MKLNNVFFPLLFLLCLSCKTPYTPASHTGLLYAVHDTTTADTTSAIEQFLQPYRDRLSGIMNEIIGVADGDFRKEKDGGSLGNLVTDAMFQKAVSIDSLCTGVITNSGGIRIPEIKKGTISKGKMYELMPFENELVIVEMKGTILEKWLNAIGEAGGWPVKFSTTLQFKDKQFISFGADTITEEKADGSMCMIIRNHPVDTNAMYRIATNDYVANGGDNCDFLKGLKRNNTGLLIRDLLIESIRTKRVLMPDQSKRIQFNH